MTTFTLKEIDNFDSNPEAILDNEKCRNVLEEFLRPMKHQQDKLDWVKLWVQVTKSLETDKKVGDDIIALMKTLEINIKKEPEKEDRKKRELMKKEREDMLNDLKRKSVVEIKKIKSSFITYLKQHHIAKSQEQQQLSTK